VNNVQRRPGGPFSELDGLGRKMPRRLHLADYLLLIVQSSPGRVRRVPERAVEGRGEATFITCPCGQRPAVGIEVGKCSGCERSYVLVERYAFVVYGDMELP
jgi:hypothetical protein